MFIIIFNIKRWRISENISNLEYLIENNFINEHIIQIIKSVSSDFYKTIGKSKLHSFYLFDEYLNKNEIKENCKFLNDFIDKYGFICEKHLNIIQNNLYSKETCELFLKMVKKYKKKFNVREEVLSNLLKFDIGYVIDILKNTSEKISNNILEILLDELRMEHNEEKCEKIRIF